MTNEFPKKYLPKEFENDIYQKWEKNWLFLPKDWISWETFYIPIPPPNVTWVLHLWHALTLTLEDIMTRYHRMAWDSTLWIPGTDHAWISTQVKVEQKLAKEWKTKFNISREEFLKECWDWTEKNGWTINEQIRKMWASCDWTKERFTLDKWLSDTVNKAFVNLYNKWLIYKWEYMVNYSPWMNTVVSDQEVIYREEKTKLYYITYFVASSDLEVIIATTRPETLLWDVAVAVNPKDKRYKKLLKSWKKLMLPIINREIPIIWDEMVDIEFWTWAVKITPAHDQNDFQVAKRHNLQLDKVVIWKDWKMTEVAWIFAWQDYLTARQNIVELLKSKWNLIKIEDHTSKVGYCERSGAKIETIISSQWFVSVESMAKKVIKWYKTNDFKIIPERFNKIFEDWIYNLRDWCISRQLIWWHQIPVWYWPDEKVFCFETESEAIESALKHYWREVELVRETDVLDTWFSSWLWPFSILNYDINLKNESELFNKFYPAWVLETWHDIIFFWVIRMLLFWYEFTNQTPFKTIYLHWLIKDKDWKKMSKSLWNWIDPLDMIEKYGTDALRLTLSIWNTPWNDLKFDEENVKNNMVFINKLWNASRFVSTNINIETIKNINIDKLENDLIENYENLMFHEKWILSRISYIFELVINSMKKYDFSDAWLELQAFTRNEFCDYYIEEFKVTKEESKFWEKVIIFVINKLLKLWHPYIPFATTEIYEKLWFIWDLIAEYLWKINLKRNTKIEKDHDLIIDVIRQIRNLRAENNVWPNVFVWIKIMAKNKNYEIIEQVLKLIWSIIKAETIELVKTKPTEENLAFWIIKAWVEVYMSVLNWLDIEKEVQRLKEQITDTKEYISLLDLKLLNENFVRNAPASLVRAEMEKKEQAKHKLEKLEEKLAKIN